MAFKMLSTRATLYPAESNNLQFTFDKVAVSPIPEAEFVTSGRVSLADLGEQQPTVTGAIQIDSAQVSKRVDLLKLARETSKRGMALLIVTSKTP